MQSLKKGVAALVIVSFCTFAAAIFAPRTAVGAGTAPVTVMNTPLDVNVVNSSLQISGTPSVKLDASGNTVTLDVPNSAHLANLDKFTFDQLGNLLVSPKGALEIKPRQADFIQVQEFDQVPVDGSSQMNFNSPNGVDATFISLESFHDFVVYSVVTPGTISSILFRLAAVDQDVRTFSYASPIPVRGIEAFCGNPVTVCNGRVTVIGYKR